MPCLPSDVVMVTQSKAAEQLNHYLKWNNDTEDHSLDIPEGSFKGWVPRSLYTYVLNSLNLPFLRLLTFPVGGTALGSLTSLRNFSAPGNYLCRLPQDFTKCQFMVSLDLSFNHFKEIPEIVFGLLNLEMLNFAHNDIEFVSCSIGKLVSLHELNLAGNILDELPFQLSRCGHLRKLDVSGKFYPRGAMAQFPKCICYLIELIDLDLSWQRVERIPDEFGNLTQLQRLNLKGNRLLHVSSQVSKCVQLNCVNLAGALRLCSQIPSALFSLVDLQCLNLSDNFFTEIPQEVFSLHHLTALIIQRNALLRLPDNLFTLPQLEHLELSENYLEQLPETIGNLCYLTYLGLDQNHLLEIPDELCNVLSLVTLIAGSNRLTKLPENICRLINLQQLMLENNQLIELPLLMDQLHGLLHSGCLSLHGNCLRIPPQEVCNLGVITLFQFLKELRVSEAHHRRKMILTGAVKAGKTSLRNALMLGHSKLTAEDERTWVLERHLWEPESRLRVQVLDFGGHHVYQAAHHMFLTPEAVHILVFDMHRYQPNADVFDELISNWFDAIMDRAPGSTILLVATHADLCSDGDVSERCADVICRVKRDELFKLKELDDEIGRSRILLEQFEAHDVSGGRFADIDVERLKENLSYLERIRQTRSQVPETVHVVCCAEGLAGINNLRDTIITILKEAEERKLPDSWYRFLCIIQAIPDHIITLQQSLAILESVFAGMSQSSRMAMPADSCLETILKYLHSAGEIVFYHDNARLNNVVFHHPETLVEMLRAVLRHDFEEVVTFNSELGRQAGLLPSRFNFLKDDFVHRGMMTYELLHYLLLHFSLSPDALDTFISLMLKFDLCYEVTSDSDPSLVGSGRILQFPWFFPDLPSPSTVAAWPGRLPANTFEFRFEVRFPRKGPPYFFEKLSVRLQRYITQRHNWKDGVLACLNHSTFFIHRGRQKKENGTVVTAAARGVTDLQVGRVFITVKLVHCLLLFGRHSEQCVHVVVVSKI